MSEGAERRSRKGHALSLFFCFCRILDLNWSGIPKSEMQNVARRVFEQSRHSGVNLHVYSHLQHFI